MPETGSLLHGYQKEESSLVVLPRHKLHPGHPEKWQKWHLTIVQVEFFANCT